ncbi:hypothetical protein QD46_25745 [Paenibacillus polymyxa]|nr:hypothetical protein QD46_25745 [Paenibacillus polymyxa]
MLFADITDYVEFGQKEEDVLGLEGDPAIDPDTGETKKYRYQHWTGHFNPEPTWSATSLSPSNQHKPKFQSTHSRGVRP